MASCTFFGHRDCPSNIRERLREEIERLISHQQVNTFYVGTQGAFDRMAYAVLKELRNKYPSFKVYRVLAYMPKPGDIDTADTILPEGIEKVHPRYAIICRNNWMINRSDYVIAYVNRTFGGAYKAVERAKQRDKVILSIATPTNAHIVWK